VYDETSGFGFGPRIQTNTRGYKMRWVTWGATSGGPYQQLLDLQHRLQRRLHHSRRMAAAAAAAVQGLTITFSLLVNGAKAESWCLLVHADAPLCLTA